MGSPADAYICYVVNCLADPHTYFGLAKGENIDIVNVATNATQSRQVFFAKLKARLRSNCFKEFGPVLGATMVQFPAINLRLHSVHAANESWEGLNLLALVMDEASAFRASGGLADNAPAVYGTLRTSANSRFASMRWIGIIISFARKQVNDFTFDKYKEALKSPTMFGDTGATWDINPQFDPGHPLFKNFEWVVLEELNLRVPKPYAEEFLKDPTDCKTKYLCQPPPQAGGFFEIPKKLDECVNRELPEIVSTVNHTTRETNGMLFRYVARVIDSLPPRHPDGHYFMHGDPGLVNDAFAVCVCHTVPESKWVTDGDGNEREMFRVVVDFVLAWEPTPETPVDLKGATPSSQFTLGGRRPSPTNIPNTSAMRSGPEPFPLWP